MKFKAIITFFGAVLTVALATAWVHSCAGSNFTGSGKSKGSKAGGSKADDGGDAPGNDDDPNNTDDDDEGNDPILTDEGLDPGSINDAWDAEDEPIRVFGEDFNGATSFKPIEPAQRNYVWAVTTDGTAHYAKIENDNVVTHKKWTGVTGGSGGSRTYVLEGGNLIVSRSGGHIYFIDAEKTPEGNVKQVAAENYHHLTGPTGDERSCLMSYKKDKKRYLGVAYGNGNFVEIPLAAKPPYKPQFGTVSRQISGNHVDTGSYSCFIDQKRMIAYVQSNNQANGTIWAVDLKAMKQINSEKAPNHGFTSTDLPAETTGPKALANKGSYAMGGDSAGNIFNGEGYYTMAFEPKSKAVFATEKGGGSNGGNFTIFPRKCLTSEPTCPKKLKIDAGASGINVGPLSSLGNGRMIGMQRSGGRIVLLTLKDVKDISKGVDMKPILDLGGDPYMYNDFTGATLYLTKSELTFEAPSALKSETHRGIGFTWAKTPDGSGKWEDIKFEVRCYKDGDSKGDYETWDKIKGPLAQSFVETASCKNKEYDRVDVRLTQENDGDSLMGVFKVQVTIYQ